MISQAKNENFSNSEWAKKQLLKLYSTGCCLGVKGTGFDATRQWSHNGEICKTGYCTHLKDHLDSNYFGWDNPNFKQRCVNDADYTRYYIDEMVSEPGMGDIDPEIAAAVKEKADQGDPTAQINFGDICLKQRDYNLAKEYYGKAAAQNLIEAECRMTIAHFQSFDPDPDADEDAEYEDRTPYCELLDRFKSIAAKGYKFSRGESDEVFTLLQDYVTLKKQATDFKKTSECCTLFTENSNIMNLLGRIHLYGKGVPQDESTALAYFTQAASCMTTPHELLAETYYGVGCGFLDQEDTFYEDISEVLRPLPDVFQAIYFFQKAISTGTVTQGSQMSEELVTTCSQAAEKLVQLFVYRIIPLYSLPDKTISCLQRASDAGRGAASHALLQLHGSERSNNQEEVERLCELGAKQGSQLSIYDHMVFCLRDQKIKKAFKFCVRLNNEAIKDHRELLASSKEALEKGRALMDACTLLAEKNDKTAQYKTGKHALLQLDS